jgi:hypothetical protein
MRTHTQAFACMHLLKYRLICSHRFDVIAGIKGTAEYPLTFECPLGYDRVQLTRRLAHALF